MEQGIPRDTNNTPQSKQMHRNVKQHSTTGLYEQNILKRRIYLYISEIGKNVVNLLESKLKKEFEGKCSIEGYIKKESIHLLSTSSGLIREEFICFDTVFECMVCCPVEGMNINNCKIENITKAGIRASINGKVESPLTIFITRDHHYDKDYFSSLNVEDIINIKVIGQRFELNDDNISIIASLIEPRKKTQFVLKGKISNEQNII